MVLYLDQGDLCTLALAPAQSRRAGDRARLVALAARGVVRVRISVAHSVETARLSWRRVMAVSRFMLRDLPHTVLARTMPGEITQQESGGRTPHLNDITVMGMPTREILRLAFFASVVGPFAEQAALAQNQTKTLMRHFGVKPPRMPRIKRDIVAAGPAQAMWDALRAASDGNFERHSRRSDWLDAMHATYAVYSDVATVDGYVFEATKSIRQHIAGPRWYRTGRIADVLAFIEDQAARPTSGT